MSKFLVFIFVAVSFSVSGQPAEADKYFAVEASHSYIEFSMKYMGYARFKGRFADFSGMIYYDETNLEKLSATITVKVESIDTDVDFRDEDLKSENWFDAKKFPYITFTSRKVVSTTAGFDVTGDLTLKGITKEISVHLGKPSGVVKDVRSDDQLIVSGTTRINRLDFGIEGKNWSGIKEGVTAVENDIDLEISLLGKQWKIGNWKGRFQNKQAPATMVYDVLLANGDAAGITEFKRIKDEMKLNEFPLINAAYMLQLEGKMNDAIVLLEENQRTFPESSKANFELAMAYLRKGDRQKAKESFQHSLQKDPNNAHATEVLRHL
jgi:polyisoprenoid-binding protein YceI